MGGGGYLAPGMYETAMRNHFEAYYAASGTITFEQWLESQKL